jgi:riboflavin synthase
MFTGIIETVGKVDSVTRAGSTAGIRVACDGFDLSDVAIGDSIAVNGVCLTVTGLDERSMSFDVSAETLDVSAGFAAEDAVNLEKSLRLDQRLGGHLVSGHVDGVGEVVELLERDGNRVMSFSFPKSLARYFARKGSVTVNGVSLTVNSVATGDLARSGDSESTVDSERTGEFSVNLIPHTLAVTNLGKLAVGSRINLEIDVVARYVESMLSAERGTS